MACMWVVTCSLSKRVFRYTTNASIGMVGSSASVEEAL